MKFLDPKEAEKFKVGRVLWDTLYDTLKKSELAQLDNLQLGWESTTWRQFKFNFFS